MEMFTTIWYTDVKIDDDGWLIRKDVANQWVQYTK
jgi:hypothetical protein